MRQLILWTLLLGAPFGFIASQLHWGQSVQAAAFDYPPNVDNQCQDALPPLVHDDSLPRFHVRTPTNYQPTSAHPLLVVFSPAGANSQLTERWVGITHEATRRGLIVAYVGSIPLRPSSIPEFAKQVQRIQQHWCIDPTRITFTGHSDGGSISQLLTLLNFEGRMKPKSIVASGAGIRQDDFESFECPIGVDVTLYHGSSDSLFPGFGQSTAQAWAQCMRCETPQETPDGCMTYRGCDGHLRYCEKDAGHYRWLPDSADLLRTALDSPCESKPNP